MIATPTAFVPNTKSKQKLSMFGCPVLLISAVPAVGIALECHVL